MIKFVRKNMLFQIAMICFSVSSISLNDYVINLTLVFAYLFLISWEYSLQKFITIDFLIWSIIFILIHLNKIYKLKYNNNIV